MNAPATESDYVSIGQLAAHVQHSVREIENAAGKLGITPALRLNSVQYYDAGQVERLTAEFRGAK